LAIKLTTEDAGLVDVLLVRLPRYPLQRLIAPLIQNRNKIKPCLRVLAWHAFRINRWHVPHSRLNMFRSSIPIVAFTAFLLLTQPAFAEREIATTAESKAVAALLQSKQNEAAYDRAVAQKDANPNSAEAHYIFGWAAGAMAQSAGMLSKIGYAKEVRKGFERAIELDPKHTQAYTGLIQFHMQAPGIAGGDEDQIEPLLVKLAAADLPAGLRARAGLKLSEKDYAGAERFLKQALAINAADGDALGTLLGTYQQTNRMAEVGPILALALAKAPNDFKVRYQSAKLAALTGQELAEGLAHVDAVIAAKPRGISMAGAHWRRGQILEKLGRKPEAIAAVELALKDGENKEIKADLARMKKSG
jgi:tetratricopeptide (TPR) repeat protein